MMLLFVVVADGIVDVAGGCGKNCDINVDDVGGSWLLEFKRRVGALLMGCSRSTLQGVPEEACSGPQLRGGGWRLGGTRDADAVGAVGLVCPALAYAILR